MYRTRGKTLLTAGLRSSYLDVMDDTTAQRLAETLIAVGCDPDGVKRYILGNNDAVASEPAPSIPDELAELMDEIDTGMVMLADDTVWLAGNPDVDPLEFRATVAELLCAQFGQFLELVAPR